MNQSSRLRSLVMVTLASSVLAACGSNGVTPSTQSENQAAAAETTPIAVLVAAPGTTLESTTEPVSATTPDMGAAQALPTAAESLGCNASAQEFQTVFLQLINEARAQPRQCGNTSHEAAAAVRWDPQLQQAAERHSRDMASRDFFSHTGSDNTSVADRVDATGYSWQRVGENIAAGQPTAQEAMQGWLDSPGHCRNLMNPDFADIAVTCETGNSTQFNTYWTNVFGTQFGQ